MGISGSYYSNKSSYYTSIVHKNLRMKVIAVIMILGLVTLSLAYPSNRSKRETTETTEATEECRGDLWDCSQNRAKRETNEECTGDDCNQERTKRETDEECTGHDCR